MNEMVARIAALQDYESYRDLHWEGSFEDYLQIVRERPQVTRNAFQRLYDMIIRYGEEEYIDNKKSLKRYNFFNDAIDGGRDAIFGLDIPLMRLVHVLQAAAQGYGPEKRVILLHGPVGSSKSTIARLLKKGIEHYSTHARRRALHVQLGQPRGHRPHLHGGRRRHLPLPHARRAAAPDSARVARQGDDAAAPRQRQVPRARSTATSIRRAASSSSA